jgi:hypothetical protein
MAATSLLMRLIALFIAAAGAAAIVSGHLRPLTRRYVAFDISI